MEKEGDLKILAVEVERDRVVKIVFYYISKRQFPLIKV